MTQRLKRFGTIVDKLCREPNMKLSQMEDIGGLRVRVVDQAQVDFLARELRKNWKIHRPRDYVRNPKSSGYRAIHLIVEKAGRRIEVQIRTVMQDIWANQVEMDSRRLRTDYKSGQGAQEVHDYYVLIAEMFAMRERNEEPTPEFFEELKERYRVALPYLSREVSE